MPTSTQYIIEEFLRSTDRRLRNNAVGALAALASPESVARLVESAIGDEDELVRTRAESALRSLEPDARALAAEHLSKALADKKRSKPAYLVLGRLRAPRPLVPLAQPTFWRRLNLAYTLTLTGPGLSKWRWRGRLVLRGVLGAFAGLIVALLYLGVAFGGDILNELGSFSLASLLFAPVLLLLVTWRSQPIPLHYYRGLGVLVELGRILVACLAVSLIFAVMMFLRGSRSEAWFPIGAGVATAVAITAARAGGILTHGISPRLAVNTLIQTVSGSLIGLVAGALVLGVLAHVAESNYDLWIFLIPGVVGVSYAYAMVDGQAPAISRVSRGGPILSLAPAALALGSFLWAGGQVGLARVQQAQFNPRSLPIQETLAGFPATVDFRGGPTGNFISVQLIGAPYTIDYLVLTLKTRKGDSLPQLGEPPEASDVPGRDGMKQKRWTFKTDAASLYRLHVDHGFASGLGSEDILPELLATFTVKTDSLPLRVQSFGSNAELSISMGSGEGEDIGRRLAPSKPLQSTSDSIREGARLTEVGKAELQQGHIGDALLAFGRAQALGGADAVTAADWNEVCWAGAIEEQLMNVELACNRAVNPDTTNPNFRDSRGVYRARTGDFQGAITDFQVYVKTPTSDSVTDEEKRQRQRWIQALRKGENPFTPDELRELRKETANPSADLRQ